MTTAWIKQSPGLYRAAKEKGSCTIITGGWCNTEDESRDCTRWCNTEEKSGIAYDGAIKKDIQ
jgi:hypothetical protein